MSAYKNFLIGVEELVYTALEKHGPCTEEVVIDYVQKYEPRVGKDLIKNILDQIQDSSYDYH